MALPYFVPVYLFNVNIYCQTAKRKINKKASLLKQEINFEVLDPSKIKTAVVFSDTNPRGLVCAYHCFGEHTTSTFRM